MAFPKWPARLRSGAPSVGGVSPADPELQALLLGLRGLVKRECVDLGDADAAQAWLSSAGLKLKRIEPPAPDGQTVILAARETDALAEGETLEMNARRRDLGAQRALGQMLGYPSCCVERFLSLDIRDDEALLRALLPQRQAPAPPETLWLIGPLSLLSHAPCSLHCGASRVLGQALLGALVKAHPGFGETWRGLAARVHTVSQDGAMLSLRLDGQQIANAVRWQVPSGSVTPHSEVPELAGERFDASVHPFVAVHTAVDS